MTGTFTVPNYLTGDGSPGNRFNYARRRRSRRAAGAQRRLHRRVHLQHPAVGERRRQRPGDARPAAAIYGHGLLGNPDEVNAGNVRTMSNDLPVRVLRDEVVRASPTRTSAQAVATLQDVSNFPKVADRTQQGFLNQLFLARLVKDPNGFASNAAFRMGASATPVLDGTVVYDGNSQGGILGGALDRARAPTGPTRCSACPGMNYSTLLQRSSDFDTYKAILNPSYPDELDRMIWFSVVQMLWDRSEADGYAEHITDDPYPGTPRHQVLYEVAFGDHQVANVTAEVAARTTGARILLPGLFPGRSPDVVPFWGITPISFLPWNGSAIVYWDSLNPAPPLGNIAPSEPAYGERPARVPAPVGAEPAAEVGVPPPRRHGDRRLRRAALHRAAPPDGSTVGSSAHAAGRVDG